MGAEVEGGGQLPSSSRVIRFHGVPSPTLLPQRSTRWWWYIDLIYSNIRLQVHVGDNFPMSSRVGRLHRRPDSRCLHSDQHIFDRDHKSKGFHHFFFHRWIKPGEGRDRSNPEQLQPPFSRPACFRFSPQPPYLSLVCLALAARVTGRCLA